MILNVNKIGTHIGKNSKRIILKNDKESTHEEIPIINLSEINILSKGITISSDAVNLCISNDIAINYMKINGEIEAKIYNNKLTGTVKTRRGQYQALYNEKGFLFAKEIIKSKLYNQKELIKYFFKNKQTNKEKSEILTFLINKKIEKIDNIEFTNIEETRNMIFGYEGQGANEYWSAIKILVEDRYNFKGREYRGTNCPVNSLLNYGYAILGNLSEKIIEKAGLDIFAGILHTDKPGKKSFLYDFIENFRPILVDRVVFSMINKRYKIEIENGYINNNTKKILIEKIEEKLNSVEFFKNKNFKLIDIIKLEAQNIASFFRDESELELYKWRRK